MKLCFCFPLLVFTGLGLPLIARAQLPPKTAEVKDAVTELIRNAMQKYQKADLNGASEDLEAARKLVDARRGDVAGGLLVSVPGWTSLRAEKQDSGFLGGSSSWKRNYESNEKSIKAEIVLDSPLIAQLTPLLTNPTIATGAGFEIKRVEGWNGLMKKTGDAVELNFCLGSGILFKLIGSGVKENELGIFAKNFSLKEMEKLKKPTAEK